MIFEHYSLHLQNAKEFTLIFWKITTDEDWDFGGIIEWNIKRLGFPRWAIKNFITLI